MKEPKAIYSLSEKSKKVPQCCQNVRIVANQAGECLAYFMIGGFWGLEVGEKTGWFSKYWPKSGGFDGKYSDNTEVRQRD